MESMSNQKLVANSNNTNGVASGRPTIIRGARAPITAIIGLSYSRPTAFIGDIYNVGMEIR